MMPMTMSHFMLCTASGEDGKDPTSFIPDYLPTAMPMNVGCSLEVSGMNVTALLNYILVIGPTMLRGIGNSSGQDGCTGLVTQRVMTQVATLIGRPIVQSNREGIIHRESRPPAPRLARGACQRLHGTWKELVDP